MPEKKLPFWRRPDFVPVVLAPVATGLLILLSFSPFNLRPLVFVALVPWLLAMPYATRKQAARSGLWFNLIFALDQMYFVVPLATKMSGTWVWSLLPWLICLPLGMMYFVPMAIAMNWSCRTGRMWLIPLIWAAVEIWRSYMWLIAFPVGLLAEPLAPYPALINSAYWLTIFGVGAWVVVGNLVIVALIRKRRPVFAAVVFVGVLALSLFQYSRPISGTPRKVVIAQPGVDTARNDPHAARKLGDAAS